MADNPSGERARESEKEGERESGRERNRVGKRERKREREKERKRERARERERADNMLGQKRDSGFRFQISGLGFRISFSGFVFGFRVSGFGFQVFRFRFRVSFSGVRFRISGFGVSNSLGNQSIRVLGLGFENNNFTEMRSGSQAGSYSRLIDAVHHPTLGLRVIHKEERERLRLNLRHQHVRGFQYL